MLIDPPYEAQDAEYQNILAALAETLARWPQATCAVWFPIKQRRTILHFLRKASALPVKSAMTIEFLVRPDDSPLRLNGSGMLLLNPPWQFDRVVGPALAGVAPAPRRTRRQHPPGLAQSPRIAAFTRLYRREPFVHGMHPR